MIEAFAKIAEVTKQLMETGFAPHHVSAGLAQVGTMVGVDRVYLYENQPFPIRGRMFADARYGWAAPGVKSLEESATLKQISLRELTPLWVDLLAQGQSVSTTLIDAPPRLRLLMLEHKTQSMVLAPVKAGKEMWGFVGFDDCQRSRAWGPLELTVLKSLASGLGTALRHRQMRSSLSQTRTQLAEMMLLSGTR
jgi:GAF domain-containing protein